MIILFLYFFLTFIVYFAFSRKDPADRLFDIYFICHNNFPLNISFEIVRMNWFIRIINFIFRIKRIETGDINFDENIYISSDFKFIEAGLKNSRARIIISKILSDPEILGIFVKDEKINLRLKTNNANKVKLFGDDFTKQYNSMVEELGLILFEASKNVKKDSYEVMEDAKLVDSKIYNFNCFYISFFIFSILFGFFFILGFKPYLYLSMLPPYLLMVGTIGFLGLISLIIFLTLKNSTRIHLLFRQKLFMVIPSCFVAGYLSIYYLNVNLDSNEIIQSEEVFVKAKKHKNSSKSGGYIQHYIVLTNPKDTNIPKNLHVDIDYQSYASLPNEGRVNFKYKKGLFNAPYFIGFTPIK